MRPQSTETTSALSNTAKNSSAKSIKSCVVAWSTVGLLCLTWCLLLLGLALFWQKNKTTLLSNTARLTQIQQQLSQTQTGYQGLQKQFVQIQQQVQQKLSANDATVRLSTMHQLMQLAYYNLIYLHDQESALSALTLADKELAALSPLPMRLEPLQRVLTHNIASLKALPTLDLSHALAELNSVHAQLTQLQGQGSLAQPIKTMPNTPITTPGEKWLSAIQSSLRQFQQLIVIRHLDKPIEPLLPQQQQQYLLYNLHVLLQQAQWALLHRQASVYQMSLQQIKTIIAHHFVGRSAETVIHTIDALQHLTLQPTLPDLQPMLDALTILKQGWKKDPAV